MQLFPEMCRVLQKVSVLLLNCGSIPPRTTRMRFHSGATALLLLPAPSPPFPIVRLLVCDSRSVTADLPGSPAGGAIRANVSVHRDGGTKLPPERCGQQPRASQLQKVTGILMGLPGPSSALGPDELSLCEENLSFWSTNKDTHLTGFKTSSCCARLSSGIPAFPCSRSRSHFSSRPPQTLAETSLKMLCAAGPAPNPPPLL